MGDDKKVEVLDMEEAVQDPWALVEPTKKGKDWSGENMSPLLFVNNDDVRTLSYLSNIITIRHLAVCDNNFPTDACHGCLCWPVVRSN